MTLRWRSNWVTRPFEGPSNDTLDWGSVDIGGTYVRLSQTVAVVIVAAPRWASFLLPPTWLSQIPHFQQINKSYFLSRLAVKSQLQALQLSLSVPYGAEKGPKVSEWNENR